MKANHGWFRLAKTLRMGLGECMEKHTDKQFALWMVWLDEELNSPDKVVSYLMEVAFEVRMLNERVRTLFGGKMAEYRLDQFRLRFGRLDEVSVSAKVAAQISKNVWAGRIGSNVVERRIPKAEGLAKVNETREEYREFLDKMEDYRGK